MVRNTYLNILHKNEKQKTVFIKFIKLYFNPNSISNSSCHFNYELSVIEEGIGVIVNPHLLSHTLH